MRRYTRNQKLPQDEVEYLKSLSGSLLKLRCHELFESGWPLSSLAEAIGRQRSTIHYWVQNPPPRTKELPAPPLPEDKSYIHKKTKSPGISAHEQRRIASLAPIARKYRSRLSDGHPATMANEELTTLVKRLYASGVPIQEIADAAGVSYRAMYRRVKR